MRIELSLGKFPASPSLQDSCSAPFGFTLEPFAVHDHVPLAKEPKTLMSDLPRCSECGAYINCSSGFDAVGWRCTICNTYTEYVKQQARRYSRSAARDTQPELRSQVFEALCPTYDLKSVREGYRSTAGPFPAPRNGAPIFLFVVDISGGPEFLDIAKFALNAAVETLPQNALVGLISLSERVGLWDVQGKAGSVSMSNVAIFEDGSVMCPLEDALPLRALVAPIATFSEQLSAAFDMLQPAPASEGLALGSAMHAILDYLGILGEEVTPPVLSDSEPPAPPFGPARLMLLLNSPPTVGQGTVDAPPPQATLHPGANPYSTSTAAVPQTPPPEIPAATRSFYDNLAALAAMLGVTVDIFAVGPRPLALAAHGALCERTGGACFFYPQAAEAALPQDLCRRLQTPQALCGLLRIRTSPELRVARTYGRIIADPEHDHLYHLVACDLYDAVAFDLEHTTKNGFLQPSHGRTGMPMIQIAFQYSMIVFRSARPSSAAADAPSTTQPRSYELQRRLRVLTVAPRAAETPAELYASLAPDPALAILMHKALRHAGRESVSDARLLLQEWLVQFIIQYHRNTGKFPADSAIAPAHIDPSLSEAPKGLGSLVHFIHALLRSPPLTAEAHVAASDSSRALALLWCALAPPELSRCVYPLLVPIHNVNDFELTRSPLSRATLRDSAASIFLLDSYLRVLVMYRSEATDACPAPPETSLRKMTNSMRQHRRIVPEVTFFREGDPAGDALMASFLHNEARPRAQLSEDVAVEAMALPYDAWLDFLQQQAMQRLSEGPL